MTTSKKKVEEAREVLRLAREEDQAGLDARKALKKKIPISRKAMEDSFVAEKQSIRAMNDIISVKKTRNMKKELKALTDAHLKITDKFLNNWATYMKDLDDLEAVGG